MSCQKDALGLFEEEPLNFVRFSLMPDNNGQLIREITSVQNVEEVDFYRHNALDTIFVPVALSTAPRSTGVEIGYSVVSSAPGLAGDLYTVLPPANSLRFSPDEQIQYIRIAFERVWEASESVELTLKLEDSSDPQITLGYPREADPMREVTISFGGTDIVNTYSLTTTTYRWPGGDTASLEVQVDFTIPALKREIGEAPDLLEILPTGICNDVSGLDYTIELEAFPDITTRLTYQLHFTSAVGPEEELFYFIRLREGLHPRYELGDLSEAALLQSPERERIDFDAAGLFTDAVDPFNRLFGYAWRYDENDQRCEWSRFAALTQPVAVGAADSNNNGKGFHKYKVANRGTNVGTNPFNMRRYFSGASVESPAYWLEEALEFFPRDASSGEVRVIPKNLEFIRRSDDESIFIPMCGEGVYFYNPELDAYQIDLEVNYNQSAIGGPASVTHYLKLFNKDVDVDLESLSEECRPYIQL